MGEWGWLGLRLVTGLLREVELDEGGKLECVE